VPKARIKTGPSDDHDAAWKVALLSYLPRFFEFFFPELSLKIDWRKKPKFKDRELQSLAPKMKGRKGGGKRLVDMLVELRWKGGDSFWVLVHIEVQAQKVDFLAKRLFFYHARIIELYEKPLCTLVVLADKDATWRPDSFSTKFAGNSLKFSFPVVKLTDFKDRLAELEKSTNPFALLVAATLHAQVSRPHSKDREERKFRLASGLYELGLNRREIVEFLSLVEHVMKLSAPRQRDFELKMKKLEKEKEMRLLTNIERVALEKGREEGLEKGLEKGRKQGLKVVLQARFKTIPEDLEKHLDSLTSEELEPLLPLAATASSLEEFASRLG